MKGDNLKTQEANYKRRRDLMWVIWGEMAEKAEVAKVETNCARVAFLNADREYREMVAKRAAANG